MTSAVRAVITIKGVSWWLDAMTPMSRKTIIIKPMRRSDSDLGSCISSVGTRLMSLLNRDAAQLNLNQRLIMGSVGRVATLNQVRQMPKTIKYKKYENA